MEVTNWLKPSDSGSRIGDRRSQPDHSTLAGEVRHVASTTDPDTATGRGIPSNNVRCLAQSSVVGSSAITFGPILPEMEPIGRPSGERRLCAF
jgi:hypothetical protein